MATSRRKRLGMMFAAGAAALALTLTGCASNGEGGSGGSDRPLRVWSGSMTPINNNFNPFSVDTAAHFTFGPIYEPLFFFNQLSADPATGLIGDKYEYSEDGTVLTIKIKADQKWSDGTALTAKDVAFTFGYGPNKDPEMVSVEATDDTTVVLTYSVPKFTAASLILGSTWIIPEHIWKDIKDYTTETNPKPVGSGPYVLKSFSDAAYTVEANPEYRDGAPAVKTVQVIGIDSNQSSEDLLKTGKIDWVGQFIANPDAITKDGRISTLNQQQDPTTMLTCSSVELGCTGAQTDPAVRQAINLAIDRTAIGDKAFAGLSGIASPSFALLPRDEKWLSNPDLAKSPQEPNIAEADGILEAAGYTKGSDGFYGKDGKAFEIDLFSPDGWTDYNDAAKLISEQAAKAGIRINNRTVSEAEYWTPLANGNFQMALYGVTQSLVADPYSTYDRYFSTPATAKVGEQPVKGVNYARYSNPIVDAEVKVAAATEDEAIKKEAYAKIQTEIARDLPYIPVVLNASQAFFNTKDYTGWPSEKDLYAAPLPYLSTASAIVLTHLKPAK
ncbi:peptide/nickel transport system substrate-binding protein [Mycetocola sp. BIGb0189]|uniref:ABC transporter substrate-binding protein n=1 Tax=Mycetocola sp. BIGb0189 TaxID=2940604 RepID=UPI0021690700|nr:ABC transporter substrate-binding protein [Mycetocola sp. BIGb0189]MCS4275266.1 peptide/nickel transport system substrate-binding protein [Mycetocola sp. BIGb0189]